MYGNRYYRKMFLKQNPEFRPFGGLWFKDGHITDGVTYGPRILYRTGPSLERALGQIPEEPYGALYRLVPKMKHDKKDVNDLWNVNRLEDDSTHKRYIASCLDFNRDTTPEVFWTNFIFKNRHTSRATPCRLGYYFKDDERRHIFIDEERFSPEAVYWVCEEHSDFTHNRICLIGRVRVRTAGYRRWLWTNRADEFGYKALQFLVMSVHFDFTDWERSVGNDLESIQEIVLHY